MNTSNSPLNTATAVGAGAVIAPVVSYVASLFHATLPLDVQSAIVLLLVAGAHKLSHVAADRAAAKGRLVNVTTIQASGSYTPVAGSTTFGSTIVQGGSAGGTAQ